MDEIDKIKAAVKLALERKGVLDTLKSKIRTEIFLSLEDKSLPMPEKPPIVFLATEIIKDYLNSFQLTNTLTVLMEESGQPLDMAVDRNFIANELGFQLPNRREESPLLIRLIEMLQEEARAVGLRKTSLDVHLDSS